MDEKSRPTTLERRISRDDLIRVHKIITGKEALSLQWERLVELAPSKLTRGTAINYLRNRREFYGRDASVRKSWICLMDWIKALSQWTVTQHLRGN